MKQIVFAILLCLAFIAQDVMGQSVRSFEARTMQAQAMGGAEGARGLTSVRGTGSRFVSATDEGYAIYETMAADETQFEVKIDDIQGPHWYSDVVISLRSTTADNSDAVSMAVNTQGRITSFKRQGGSISRSSSVASINMPGQVRLVYDRDANAVAIEYRTENGNWLTKDTHTLNVGATPIVAVFPRNRGIGPTLDVEAVANVRNIALRNPSAAQAWSYDQACLDALNSHRLHDFQTDEHVLTTGPLDYDTDSAALFANSKIINDAIDSVASGQEHAILCLPEGRFDVINPQIMPGIHNHPRQTGAISINQSDVTLWGAGRDDKGTAFYSNGRYDLIEGEVFRGDGIRIINNNSNITLRDFALNGQGALPSDSTAWTGCKGWRSDEDRINCWDTSHKGLTVAQGGGIVDNVLVERVAVRSYKGEMIYQGGRDLRKAVFRDIISEDTNAQGFNVHGTDVLVEDSYFGLSNQWYEIEALWGEGDLNMMGVHRNNTFDKCTGNQCISIAQGDNTTVPFTFEDNHFTGCNYLEDRSGAVMGIAEATGGPLYFRNNTLVGCYPARPILGGGEFSGPIANVIIEDNHVIEVSGYFIRLRRDLVGWEIRANYFEGDESASNRRVVRYGGGATRNSIIENNTFVNESMPMEEGSGTSKIPLWTNNTYTHGGPGTGGWRTQSSGDLDEVGFKPLYEFLNSNNGSSFATDPFFNTTKYPDGFRVSIGLSHDWRDPIHFTTEGHPSYSVTENVTLEWGERVVFEFDAANEAWIFLEKTTE